MKQWQVRGEVLDSDDDHGALSLGSQSPSPERPHKRIKFTGSDHHAFAKSTSPRALDEGVLDGPPASHPRSTTNRSVHTDVVGVISSSSVEPSSAANENAANLPQDQQDDALKSGDEPTVLGPGVKSLQAVLIEPFEANNDIDTSAKSKVTQNYRLDIPGDILGLDSDVSDDSSSILSERELSPPPGFEFLNPATQALQEDHDLVRNGFAAQNFRRRNLRTRKEIQLHPYLLDRAAYLKQCRQRGMRPVRLQEQSHSLEESQDRSLEVDHERVSSSPPKSPTKSVPKAPPTIDHSLGYFDLASQSSDGMITPNQLPKRTWRSLGRKSISAISQSDTFSLPPSPPRTGSHLATPVEPTSRQASPRFRLPFGMSTAQLPTPQISSDIKHPGVEDDSSSDSLPQRRVRRSNATKLSRGVTVVSSPSESSSSEESEVDIKRLRREQKRIKGVLPASWLKLDFLKHQEQRLPSPMKSGYPEIDTPPQTSPRKGVAQKIQSRRLQQRSHTDLPTTMTSTDDHGNDDSESESLNQSPGLRRPQSQPRHIPSSRRQTANDVMENDWFDPMFGGSSRSASKAKKKRERQPRITENFSATNRLEAKFSNERSATAHRKNGLTTKLSGKKKRTRSRVPRDVPVRLSIVDAPRPADLDESLLPQFLKVALRHSRRQENHGRHSPTNKLIRMTTERDTEDALSVLRAWREGKLGLAQGNQQEKSQNEGGYRSRNWKPSVQRTPLAERSSNKSQQHQKSWPRLQVSSTKHSPSNVYPQELEHVRPQSEAVHNVSSTAPGTGPENAIALDIEPPTQTRRRVNGDRFPRVARVRGAQIETLASEFDHRHRATIFERRMQQLTEHAAKHLTQRKPPKLIVLQSLQSERTQPADRAIDLTIIPSHAERQRTSYQAIHHPKVIRQRRKNRATRIDADTREYRQPDEPALPLVDDHPQEPNCLPPIPSDANVTTLKGLGIFGAKYPLNFDIRPLPLGVYFRKSTFIGSGEFHHALQQYKRDVDKPAGSIRVEIDGRSMVWGPWTEDVATGFDHIVKMISIALHGLDQQLDEDIRRERCEDAGRVIDHTLLSVIRYCSDNLWFVDPVDVRTCCESLYRLVTRLMDTVTDVQASDEEVWKALIQIRNYSMVMAVQASQLCSYRLVDLPMQSRVNQLLLHIAESIVGRVIPRNLQDLQSFYEDTQRSAVREAGINDKEITLATIVLLYHTLSACQPGKSFWQLVNASFDDDIARSSDVSVMEKVWCGVFTILPALEFDSTGIAKADSALGQGTEDWSLVRGMLVQVLNHYDASILVPGSTINTYIRGLLARCHLLINKWGWWRCEQLLGSVYDFFAQRGLAFLNHEENHGTPRFIEHLADDPSLEIDADDRSFHIFLKMLASGLQGMQRHSIYDDRKIGGMTWRFIPSHGRTYRKDVELMTSDLDALRNHFDLLITIYFASPAGHRPRVELLQNLVDHNNSHREACRLSIRAWTYLASFQTSTSESADVLRPLIKWFNQIFVSAVSQYRLARSEAEHDVEIAKQKGAFGITSTIVENTVAKNQQQIAATLIDALAGLKRAVSSSKNIANVIKLSGETNFTLLFELFDPNQQRLANAVVEAMNLIDTILDVQQKFEMAFESQHASEDSQDFGDCSALHELVVGETNGCTISRTLHEPISQFLSNVLGADECAEDGLLQRLIDTWTRLIAMNVERGETSWTSYTDDYSAHSWNRLRDTRQKRKFAPYFMARVVDHAGHEPDIKQEALTTWLLSLVEREAALKYQHVLTSALLVHCTDDPLLRSLSFSGHSQKSLSRFTLDDLRLRRLELISGVLSNMRETCEYASVKRSGSTKEVRIAYAGMLRKMMQAMKANYQDLQASYDPKVANGNAQGAYVEFVQHVVTCLQQHTTDICPIDRFFTDSTAFPLPANDPTYIIGRLRSYTPKLSDTKTRKQLAVFVQTVSERAATDAQQAYLVDQFTAAMTTGLEHGDSRAPSLRHVLLTSVFPAYYDGLVLNKCDWILALPMLEASQHVLDDLFYCINIDNKQSVAACVQILHITTRCVNRQCTLLLSDHSVVWHSRTYRSVAKLLDVATACLMLVSYISRCTGSGREVVLSLQQLRRYSTALEMQMNSSVDEFSDTFIEDEIVGVWPDTKTFATNQIRSALDQHWSAVDNHYEMQRGISRKEITVHLGNVADERDRLVEALRHFVNTYDSTFNARTRSRRSDTRLKHFGLVDLVV